MPSCLAQDQERLGERLGGAPSGATTAAMSAVLERPAGARIDHVAVAASADLGSTGRGCPRSRATGRASAMHAERAARRVREQQPPAGAPGGASERPHAAPSEIEQRALDAASRRSVRQAIERPALADAAEVDRHAGVGERRLAAASTRDALAADARARLGERRAPGAAPSRRPRARARPAARR